MWTHYLLLDWAGRAGVLGLGTTVWFIFAAVWMLRRRVVTDWPESGQKQPNWRVASVPVPILSHPRSV